MNEIRPNPETPHDPPEDDGDDLTSELVAYLDGELDPQGNEVVEARIGVDATVRAEADALKKTWDLLDYLPRTEPSPSFTERTISRIEPRSGTNGAPNGSALAGIGASTTPSSRSAPVLGAMPRRSLGRRLATAAGFVIALLSVGVGGYFIRAQVNERLHHFDQQEQDAKILSERPLLQNLRSYRYVDDLEFLEALDNPDLFGEEHLAPVNEVPK